MNCNCLACSRREGGQMPRSQSWFDDHSHSTTILTTRLLGLGGPQPVTRQTEFVSHSLTCSRIQKGFLKAHNVGHNLLITKHVCYAPRVISWATIEGQGIKVTGSWIRFYSFSAQVSAPGLIDWMIWRFLSGGFRTGSWIRLVPSPGILQRDAPSCGQSSFLDLTQTFPQGALSR